MGQGAKGGYGPASAGSVSPFLARPAGGMAPYAGPQQQPAGGMAPYAGPQQFGQERSFAQNMPNFGSPFGGSGFGGFGGFGSPFGGGFGGGFGGLPFGGLGGIGNGYFGGITSGFRLPARADETGGGYVGPSTPPGASVSATPPAARPPVMGGYTPSTPPGASVSATPPVMGGYVGSTRPGTTMTPAMEAALRAQQPPTPAIMPPVMQGWFGPMRGWQY